MSTTFDKTEEFNRDIKPLIEEIQKLCMSYHVPFFATFAIKQNEETDMKKDVTSNVAGKSKHKKEGMLTKETKSNVVEENVKNQSYCLLPAMFSEIKTNDKTFGRLVDVMNGAYTSYNNSNKAFDNIDVDEL